MDELIYYNARGNSQDKKHATAFSYLASLHTTKTFHQYRQSPSSPNASVNLSIGHGSHLLVALPEKPMLHVYLYGKESPEQFIPLPEILTCLTTYKDTNSSKPTLLLGGSKTGKLYIWSLNSGLLLTVKQGHYQPLTHIATYSGFIATGSEDSRVVIHSINSIFMKNLNDDSLNDKPFSIITDHTLPITSLTFNKGLNNDVKLITSSMDSTVRIYSLTLSNKVNLVTNIVSEHPVTSVGLDPAFRTIYLGLSNGQIRSVPMFKTNPRTKVIEAVGGLGKIVTLKPDVDLLDSFTCHQDTHNSSAEKDIAITQLKVSMDGTLLISGDKQGSLLVIDITTKQIRKKLKELVGEITNIELWTVRADDPKFENSGVDKSLMRSIPVLKRSIVEAKDLDNEVLIMKLVSSNSQVSSAFDLQSFLDTVQDEEKAFTNFTAVDSKTNIVTSNSGFSINVDKNTIADLKKEIEEKTAAYNDLKSKHDALLAQYTSVISEQ